MKKEEKLKENIIAILELNKRKWDEEHPSKHDENTIKNLVDNLELKKMLELEKSYIEKINMKSVQNLGKNLKNIKNIKDILSYPNLTIKELLGEVVDDNDMPNFLEKLNEMDIDKIISGDSKWIEIIRDFKQQKENKENKSESEYSSTFNSNFFNSESVAESKSKNIFLNISSSINLNVSNLNAKETINLTINVS